MLNIVFMGSPQFSVPALEALVAHGHTIKAVYSQPPRKKGRGHKLQSTEVAQKALSLNIPVETPVNFKSEEAINTLKSYNADVFVVVAYGLILPQAVLDIPPLGAINIHGSLLPRWRGAAPIHRALLAGDKETGITIMQMDKGCDTGPVALKEAIDITSSDTFITLHDRLSYLGAEMIIKALAAHARDTLTFTPQTKEGACYAPKMKKEESVIDWNHSAHDIFKQAQAHSPFPGLQAFMKIDDQQVRVKLFGFERVDEPSQYEAETGHIISPQMGIFKTRNGALKANLWQREGKAKQSPTDFFRGLENKRWNNQFITPPFQ